MKTILILVVSSLLLTACTASDVETQSATLGQQSDRKALVASLSKPSVIQFQKIPVANWQVPLSGLLNLEHPKAVEAGLVDRDEPIQIYLYVISHPTRGNYFVDSGVSVSFKDIEANDDVSFVMKKAMNFSKLEVLTTTKDVATSLGGVDGVFLTHIHTDHIMGLIDLKRSVPVYSGPGEASSRLLTNLVAQGTTNRLLANTEKLLEWQFGESGILDVFGDGSLWAIHVPGHSPGSTAYLANTINGPELMIGDATHTRWGWDNQVEPGTYSKDIALSVKSLAKLSKLVAENPQISAHPGHQN